MRALRLKLGEYEMTTNIDLPEIDEEIIESIFEAADFGDGDVIAAIVKEYATEAVLLNLEKKND